MLKLVFALIVSFLFSILGCNSSSSSSDDQTQDHNVDINISSNFLCNNGEFYKLKSKECIDLKHPQWGFKEFEVPKENIFTLQECTQDALLSLLSQLPKNGAKVVLPECTIQTEYSISLFDNVILEGAGVGKSIITGSLHDMISLKGKNIVVRNITLDGKGKALGGVVGTYNKGNILIENMQIKDLRGSGVYLVTNDVQSDTAITIRQNSISQTLHGIVVKTKASAKMLIYSNNLFDNKEYGIDISTTSDIEVSGNYMHDNFYAGAKTPLADNIYFYYNDINYNGKSQNPEERAGLVYMGSNPTASIYVEYNDLTNNHGVAFACWSARFSYLLLRDNKVDGSYDSNGYNIRATGIDNVDIYGDHGRIWAGENSNDRLHFY